MTRGVDLSPRQQAVPIVVLMECPKRSRRAAVFQKYGPLVIEVTGLHATATARLLDPHAVVVIVKGDGGRRFASRRQHLVTDAEMISRSRPSLLSSDLVEIPVVLVDNALRGIEVVQDLGQCVDMIERHTSLTGNLSVFEGAINRLAGPWIRSLLGQPIAVWLIGVRQLARRVRFVAIGHAQQPAQVVVRIGRRFQLPAVDALLGLYLGQPVTVLVIGVGIARERWLRCGSRTVDNQFRAVGAVIGIRITMVPHRPVWIFDRLDQAIFPVRILGCPRFGGGRGQSVTGIVRVGCDDAVRVDDLRAVALDVVVVLDALTDSIVVVTMQPRP